MTKKAIFFTQRSGKVALMMKTHPFFAFLALFLLCLGLSVQPAQASDVGPHIKLSVGQKLSGHFMLQHESLAPSETTREPFSSSGHFVFAPGQQIVWSIEKPFPSDVTISEGKMSFGIGEHKMLDMKTGQLPFLANLESYIRLALNSDWSSLKNDFDIKTSGSNSSWTITVTPHDDAFATRPFEKMVARGGRFVESADVYSSKSIEHVTLTNQTISSAP